MSESEKTRYSAAELTEFEELITNKLNKAKEELKYINLLLPVLVILEQMGLQEM